MTVVKVIELVGESPNSWEEAARNALDVASKTIRNIIGIDVKNFTAKVENNKITLYRADVKVAFKYEG